MTPWGISERDLQLIRTTMFLALVDYRRTGRFECLEWGAGGSTLMFPKWLADYGINFNYTSIEHDTEWHRRVVEQKHFATVHLVREDGCPHRSPMDDYVDYPLSLGRQFSFVFVDGRKRRRCLEVASKLLAVGGVVVLHDAERPWYHGAFDNFTRHERIGDKLWRGWVDV